MSNVLLMQNNPNSRIGRPVAATLDAGSFGAATPRGLAGSAHGSRLRAAICLIGTLLLSGCATPEQKGDAIGAVNRAFRAEYEAILAEKGTRVVNAAKLPAFEAMRVALARVGMHVEGQDPDLGYLAVAAAAPRPLDLAEWRRAAEADLPHLREITRTYVGVLSDFIRFEPEGLDVIINATVIETQGRTEVSLTVRLREVAPPRSGIPRREYVTPTAVRMGLDKIWTAFEQELQSRAVR